MTSELRSLPSTNESINSFDIAVNGLYPPWSIPVISGLSIFGLRGNILVCFTLWKANFLHNNTNYLIVNLAITYSLVCVFSALQLLWDKLVFPSSEIPKHIFCRLLLSDIFKWLPFTASALALVLVSLERFIGIVYPLNYQQLITTKRIRIAIFFQWIVTLITEAHSAIFTVYGKNENACVFKFHVVFFALQIIICYVFPVVTLIYLYYRMFSNLQSVRPNGGNDPFDARTDENWRARRNILINLFIVTILFKAFLTPTQVIFRSVNP